MFYLDCVSLVQNVRGPGYGRRLPQCKRNKSPLVMKRQNLKVDVICVPLYFVGSKLFCNTNMESVFSIGNAAKCLGDETSTVQSWKRPSPLETTKIRKRKRNERK